MSDEIQQAMLDMRKFMFENVYLNPTVKHEEGRAERLVESLFHYYMDNPSQLPDKYKTLMNERGDSLDRVVCDYVSAMSDKYAIGQFQRIFMPSSWKEV